MAIINPFSTTSTTDDALDVTLAQTNSTIIVRDGIFLLADGGGNNAIDVNSGSNAHTILIDGYLASDNADALELNDTSNHEIAIGKNGQIAAVADGVGGSGTTIMLTNDGTIVAGSNAVSLGGSGLTSQPLVVNNGSMTAAADAISLGDGGWVTNNGSLASHGDGIFFGNYDGTNSDSTLINTGTIQADDDGVAVFGANFTGTNTGAIIGESRGLELLWLADDSTFTNNGIVAGSDDGIYAQGLNTTISNGINGSIAGSMGIEFTDANGTVVNEGIITGEAEDGVRGENNLTVTNAGTIAGSNHAIYATSVDGLSTGLGAQVVMNTGILSGGNNLAVYLEGFDGMVDNRGKILSANDRGVHIDGDGGVVVNSGDIDSRDTGIWLEGGDGVVTNSGTITTDDEGIFLSDEGAITNTGVITTRTGSIYMGSSILTGTITNAGDVTSRASVTIQIYTETGFVLNSGALTAGVYGIFSNSEDGSIVNSGAIAAGNNGIYHTAGLGEFRITNTGDVAAGEYAIFGTAGDEIVNQGALNGQRGIFVNANANTANTNILNGATGVIDGEDYGIYLFDSDEDAVIVNHGSVRGGIESVHFENAVGSEARLVNTGSLIGDVQGDTGVQIIANSGVIAGDVNLDDGADFYRSLASGVVSGTVNGEVGEDSLIGGASNDNFDGGDGADLLVGHGGDDTLLGGADNDLLVGNDGDDYAEGGQGADTVKGGAGEDELYGGTENDTVTGGANDDLLDGGSGLDVLDGGAGNDTMLGGLGNDLMRGRDGVDFLTGGQGLDILTGGTGADVFVYVALTDSTADAQRDVILDFEKGVDEINLFDVVPGPLVFRGTAGFTATGTGELRLQETVAGSTIVRVDADGNGTTDMEINVAQVQGLTANDFVL